MRTELYYHSHSDILINHHEDLKNDLKELTSCIDYISEDDLEKAFQDKKAKKKASKVLLQLSIQY